MKKYYKLIIITTSILAMFIVVILVYTNNKKTNYQILQLDTLKFATSSHTFNYTNVETVEISLDNILNNQYQNISIEQNIITFSETTLINYQLPNLNGYCLVFLNPAYITLNGSIKNSGGSCIVSKSSLAIFGSGEIFSGNKAQTIKDFEQPISAAIYASDINLVCDNITITSNYQNGISAKNINIYKGTAIISAPQSSLYSDDINIYGGITNLINNTYGINCLNVSIFGSTLNINSSSTAIDCDYLTITNGEIYINSLKTAIACREVQKLDGLLSIKSSMGIISTSIVVNGGYLYADTTLVGLRAKNNININGGINIIVASKVNCSAIDAENKAFSAEGGILICCSTYACIPKSGKVLAVAASEGDIFTLSGLNNVAYVVPIDCTMYISGHIKPTSFSLRAKIVSYSTNFYGLLGNCKVNTLSNISVSSKARVNIFNAKIYNQGEIINLEGQLF